MIISIVCNTNDACALSAAHADNEGAKAGASCLDRARKVAGWWEFESHEGTREKLQEDLYTLRLFAVEEVILATWRYK